MSGKWWWVVVAVGVVGCGPVWAQKTSVDPNRSGAASSASVSDGVDARLSQKITYDGGSKRLHVVIDDLSQMSGVKIACGSNAKDWQVRDIPVVVCVKDMSLGKLLRTITDATHTKFTSERTGDDKERAYRVYRRSKEKAEVATVLSRQREAAVQHLRWKWDALATFGKTEESKVPKQFLNTWLMGRIAASAGPEAVDKLLSGETFMFRGSDPAVADAVSRLYRMQLDMQNSMDNESFAAEIKDIEAAGVEMRMQDSGSSGGPSLVTQLYPVRRGNTQSLYDMGSAVDSVEFIQEAIAARAPGYESFKLPERPKSVEFPSASYDMDNPTMTKLPAYEKWEGALFDAKVKLEKSKDGKAPVFADLVSGLSAATGCDFVVEDFSSHMVPKDQEIDKFFGTEMTVGEILQAMVQASPVPYTWFVSKDAGLIVGWADGWRGNWRDIHSSLVSEAYLKSLKAKLDGPGAELDDAIEILGLPQTGSDLWIYYSAELGALRPVCMCDNAALWRLYGSLEAEDKLAARSKGGFPLAKLGVKEVAEYLRDSRTQQTGSHTFYSSEERKQAAEKEKALNTRAMSDPAIISSMVMRVEETVPNDGGWVPQAIERTSPTGKATDGPKRCSYKMVIDCKIDGEEHKLDIPYTPRVLFPLWSAEREAAIKGKPAAIVN